MYAANKLANTLTQKEIAISTMDGRHLPPRQIAGSGRDNGYYSTKSICLKPHILISLQTYAILTLLEVPFVDICSYLPQTYLHTKAP